MTPERRGYPVPAARFVTAEQLAGHLGVSRPRVYEHKLELGYVPLGNGPKARLRCARCWANPIAIGAPCTRDPA
jgi:hypothetical protein